MNFQRVDELIAFLEANPERHNQLSWWDDDLIWQNSDDAELKSNWQCHTTACAAGWTAIRAGWRPVDTGTDRMIYDPDPTRELINPLSDEERDGITNHSFQARADRIAAHILELNPDEQHALFLDARSLNQFKAYVEVRRAGLSAYLALSALNAARENEDNESGAIAS